MLVEQSVNLKWFDSWDHWGQIHETTTHFLVKPDGILISKDILVIRSLAHLLCTHMMSLRTYNEKNNKKSSWKCNIFIALSAKRLRSSDTPGAVSTSGTQILVSNTILSEQYLSLQKIAESRAEAKTVEDGRNCQRQADMYSGSQKVLTKPHGSDGIRSKGHRCQLKVLQQPNKYNLSY